MAKGKPPAPNSASSTPDPLPLAQPVESPVVVSQPATTNTTKNVSVSYKWLYFVLAGFILACLAALTLSPATFPNTLVGLLFEEVGKFYFQFVLTEAGSISALKAGGLIVLTIIMSSGLTAWLTLRSQK